MVSKLSETNSERFGAFNCVSVATLFRSTTPVALVTVSNSTQTDTINRPPPGHTRVTDERIPDDHPRADSLRTRHRIERGVERGITSRQGLIAHGRGEAFDYLLGEETLASADRAARAGAAHLLLADHPVISVNGNVAALVPEAVVELAEATGAAIEVNLFNRTPERMRAITDHLEAHGATDVKGLAADARIPGLSHERAKVDADGIARADCVVVPLEDGDRAAALSELGKTEIVIDLNPLSRSIAAAAVPIVDEITRAVPRLTHHARALRDEPRETLEAIVREFDRDAVVADAERAIRTGASRTDDRDTTADDPEP